MKVEYIRVIYVLKVHTTAVSPPRTHAASSARLALRLFSIRQQSARILVLLPAVLGGEAPTPKKLGGDRLLAPVPPPIAFYICAQIYIYCNE